jgi:hypothetical protein
MKTEKFESKLRVCLEIGLEQISAQGIRNEKKRRGKKMAPVVLFDVVPIKMHFRGAIASTVFDFNYV